MLRRLCLGPASCRIDWPDNPQPRVLLAHARDGACRAQTWSGSSYTWARRSRRSTTRSWTACWLGRSTPARTGLCSRCAAAASAGWLCLPRALAPCCLCVQLAGSGYGFPGVQTPLCVAPDRRTRRTQACCPRTTSSASRCCCSHARTRARCAPVGRGMPGYCWLGTLSASTNSLQIACLVSLQGCEPLGPRRSSSEWGTT